MKTFKSFREYKAYYFPEQVRKEYIKSLTEEEYAKLRGREIAEKVVEKLKAAAKKEK